jgi:hypothetical protein
MKSPRIRLYQSTCRDGNLRFKTQREAIRGANARRVFDL